MRGGAPCVATRSLSSDAFLWLLVPKSLASAADGSIRRHMLSLSVGVEGAGRGCGLHCAEIALGALAENRRGLWSHLPMWTIKQARATRRVQFQRGRQPCGSLGVETHLKSLRSPASRSRERAWGHSLVPTAQPEPRVLLWLLHIARPRRQGGGPCGALKSTSTFGTEPE